MKPRSGPASPTITLFKWTKQLCSFFPSILPSPFLPCFLPGKPFVDNILKATWACLLATSISQALSPPHSSMIELPFSWALADTWCSIQSIIHEKPGINIYNNEADIFSSVAVFNSSSCGPNCPSNFISYHISLYQSCSYPNCLLSEPWTPQGNAPLGPLDRVRTGVSNGEAHWSAPPHTHSRSLSGSHKCRVFALAVLTVRNTTAFFCKVLHYFPSLLNIFPGFSFFFSSEAIDTSTHQYLHLSIGSINVLPYLFSVCTSIRRCSMRPEILIALLIAVASTQAAGVSVNTQWVNGHITPTEFRRTTGS